MKLESQIKITNLRLQGAEAKAREAEEMAVATEVVARATKAKVA